MLKKKALITGITGQDGAYLAEYLLSLGYEVHGIKRRSSLFNTERIDHLYKDPHEDKTDFFLHYGDLTDSLNITRLIQKIQPDEIYNLGAQSHVAVSFEQPEYTANVDGLGILRILEAVRLLGLKDKIRIYQASTSELFGGIKTYPQDETTGFYPKSPYGVAKLYAYWITVNYREAYGIYACNGILFNHESPIRGETFVSRKITRGVSRIILGLDKCIFLGNLNAKRDWGHAKDYVKGMHLILQQPEPDDYVLATGVSISVRDFVKTAFKEYGIDIVFVGRGVDECGIVENIDDDKILGLLNQVKIKEYQRIIDNVKKIKGERVVAVDTKYFRPSEVDMLVGNPSKAMTKLGWKPTYTINDLIKEMVRGDLARSYRDFVLKKSGFDIVSSCEL
ncbi:MAG: GDP-mannose 4,6-dehydratase [Thermodesulfovibrionales bacterium]|nr:GDP-mannose 4,6-dehydratase [Thermodesulfovibrionales bacterium]